MWQQNPPPPWQQPPGPPPPVSGTANAALTIAALSIPAGVFALAWVPAAAGVGGMWLVYLMIATLLLLPQILGYRALQEIKAGRAHPISRQRAILAMGVSGMFLLLASGIFASWLTGI